MIRWPMKFVENITLGREELFDLSRDPHEEHNLFAIHAAEADALSARLAAWSAALPRQSREARRLTDGDRKGLEGLGYVSK